MVKTVRNAVREIAREPRQHLSTLLICAVAAFFGAAMIVGTQLLAHLIAGPQGADGAEGGVALMLGLLGTVFFGIAIFVAAIVVVNTFSIVVAGRTRTIALLRLLGASASSLRRGIGVEGLIVGGVGAVLGTVLADVAALGAAAWLERRPDATPLGFAITPATAVPGAVVVLMAWWAAWRGARPVLAVSPIEGTRRTVEPALKTLRRGSRALLVLALLGIVLGVGLLGLGVLVGFASSAGVLLGFLGGIVSFTGIALGSAWIMPAFLGLAGLPLRASAAGRLAAGSARRHPLRASRTSMGLVIGITLIMMFATLGQTFQTVMTRRSRELGIAEDQTSSIMRSIDDVLWFLTAMLVFSLVIAAIGVVDNMQASVMQRTRELGMLRTIGLSTAGLWRMILAETAQLTLAAALFAIPLGILYGWCGALSMLASVDGIGFFLPTPPWAMIGLVLLGCAVITGIAAALPARRVTRVSPVASLAAD